MDIVIVTTQLLKVSNVYCHIYVKTPLVNCIVNDALVHSMPSMQFFYTVNCLNAYH